MVSQELFAGIWLALTILAIGIVLFWYLRSSRKDPTTVYEFISKSRRWVFIVLTLGLFIGLTLSVFAFPYPQFKENPVYHVEVKGSRFYWTLNTTTVPANKPVAFHVTSVDVNHGFGIYTSDGRLIAQVQAMPGYTNTLIVKLKPGEYIVACMEYCGIAHHVMVTKIKAVEG